MSRSHRIPLFQHSTRDIRQCQRRTDFGRFYRSFHDYFITHIPSSSLHPDSRPSFKSRTPKTSSYQTPHRLPREASKPHDPKAGSSIPLVLQNAKDTTVVRIPLRSAKHHFGASVSRGTRAYNEDAYQAGVIGLPAFAKRAPGFGQASGRRMPAGSPLENYREMQRQQVELARQRDSEESEGDESISKDINENESSGGASGDGLGGDPQVFYFGVFDGHGGTDCSGYLSQKLHEDIENTAKLYHLRSTVSGNATDETGSWVAHNSGETSSPGLASLHSTDGDQVPDLMQPLLKEYKENIGGYFRRFNPIAGSSSGMMTAEKSGVRNAIPSETETNLSRVLMHTFLQTDLNFLLAQFRLSTSSSDERAINYHDSMYSNNNPPSTHGYESHRTTPFYGGSTASIAMISTPTPMPFWNPSSPSTLVTAHVGDTRILLCRVSDGLAIPLTTNHHPSTPSEATRLRRWAASFVTDSFGEERMSGLANTRAFGDMRSKRLGVSAEPEIRHTPLPPSVYSFLLIVSDGISGIMSDQEMVDIIKESKTPELGAREIVSWATDVGAAESEEGADNATALVVRLGGWERRDEGGTGSVGTREQRQWRRREAGEGPGRGR